MGNFLADINNYLWSGHDWHLHVSKDDVHGLGYQCIESFASVLKGEHFLKT
jgi:hypothetical protein